MDWRDSRSDAPGFKTELLRNYEAGKIIILKNSPLSIDYDLLNELYLPKGRQFQKLSYKTLIYPKMYKADIAKLMLAKFGRSPVLYFKLRREIMRVTDEVRRFVRDVFKPYRIQKESVSWRFTPTGPEALHVDWFRPTEDLHYVRMFINIDEEPRVWTVSHQLEELIARNYASAQLARLGGCPSNSIIDRINRRVLNPVSYEPASKTDRHVVEFSQGDVWLCETPDQFAPDLLRSSLDRDGLLRRSELDARPGAARRGAGGAMHGALRHLAGKAALIGLRLVVNTGWPGLSADPRLSGRITIRSTGRRARDVQGGGYRA
jgi:3-deoxy-D-manno-oct-2-ulosonic acid (Kdo) hydroxylase